MCAYLALIVAVPLQIILSQEGLCSACAQSALGCDDASQHRPHPAYLALIVAVPLQIILSQEGFCSSRAQFALGCDDASQHRPDPDAAH